MDETVTAILLTACAVLLASLVIPRLGATVEEWFEALW